MDARYFDFVFRGIGELDGVKSELEELLAINVRLQNQNLENAKKAREERDARRQAAEEAKQAAMAQIQAELGVGKALDSQKGIIEELRNRIKLLKQGREEANDVATINKYNAALQISQKELNTLTGATDKFKGSNGFWREMSGYVATAFAVSSITDWTGKVFEAQSKTEAFSLSLKRLVGEKEAAVIENQLKNLIVDTPLQFDGAVKGVEKLVFAYQNAGQSTKTVIKDFEAFGNVSKGNEENLKGVIKALDDTGNQGKLTGQEVLQFGNAGVNIIGLLAESMGKTRKEIKQMQSDGEISFAMVREALLKAGSEGGKFAGAMSVAMGTVSGKVSNFKDAVFFAMSNTGEYFKENAKSAVSWATSLVQSLFGTESATKRTIDIVKTGIGTWIAYEVATRASAAATLANTTIQKIGLVIKGETILANSAMTGSYNVLTAAETEATVAARAFNATLASNPFGLIVLAIGTAVAGYQMYKASVESAQEEQKKLSSNIADALVPLKSEQIEFNTLTKAVLNTNLATEERKKKLDELKAKFPEQLTGINNLQDAELKLGGVIRSTNADFVTRAKLLENEVRINYNREKANVWLKEQIELEAKLATASTQRTTMVTGTAGNIQTYASEREEIQKAIDARKRWVNNALESNETIAKYGESLTGKLKYQYEEQAKAATGSNDKAKKEKIDSLKTLALIQEKADNDALEKTRRTEQKSLELQRDIDIQRINDSKASAAKKSAERLKIEEKYFVDSSKLTNKYDEDEAKEQEKRNREWLKANYEMHKDTLDQAAKKMAEQQKLNQKEYDEKKKLDEKVAKETEKLNEDKYELVNKLRILDKISHAKNSEEIIKIENREKETILDEAQKNAEKLVLIANLKMARMKVLYGEDSVQYKESLAEMVIAQQGYTDVSIKLAEFRTEKAKDEAKKQEEIFKQAIGYVTQITDGLFDLLDRNLDSKLAKSTNAIENRMLEHTKAEAKITKDALGAMTSLATGDIPGAISKGISVIFSAMNAEMEREMAIQKAKAEEYARIIGERIQQLKNGIQSTTSSMSEIGKIYADEINKTTYNLTQANQSQIELMNRIGQTGRGNLVAYDKAIQAEIEYGRKVLENYENAVKAEEKLFNDRIDNINREFDLRDLKATQVYNKETLSIVAAGSAQLEALITNEASLSSVREEFAKKRLAIEQSFPLASKAITADMSQSEIDAINASIKARDEQFAKIQAWYNEELIFIATSEGQKRKEYTDTEKIQNEIRNNLELAAIKFQADEIQRQKDKDDDIIMATKAKKDAIQKLEEEKDLALAASFQRLSDFMKQQIAEVQAALAALKPENVEQFKELQAILQSISEAYKQLTGINPASLPVPATPATDTPARGPRGFYKGTERLPNMSGKKGIDTELIKADVGERIIPTYLNDMLKAKFGSDITNEGLVFRALNPLPIMNYDAIANMNVQPTGDKFVLSELKKLNKSMKEMKQVNVNVVNGHPSVEERSSNRMIKYVS